MRRLGTLLIGIVAAAAAPVPAPSPSPGEIVAAAPTSAWTPIDPAELLVMTLGDGRRVVIELAPRFAPVHVANIRALVRGGWFDGAAVVRVQDDYVAQWGGDDAKRTLPPGVVAAPPPEYERSAAGLPIRPLASRDAYAPRVGFAGGWPVASDGRSAWLPHCYAMVGVGRDMPPDAGTGAELYAVIGHAPRHLDRNIAVVGRVVDGIDVLASLPRGTGELGAYRTVAERVPIRSVRIASDLPATARPSYESMRTDAPAFAAYADARANRRDAFFVRPAGGADLCNVPVPVRRAK